jgi:hypothetical protein
MTHGSVQITRFRADNPQVNLSSRSGVFINDKWPIPDGVTEDHVNEVKNVKQLGWSAQLGDELAWAQDNKRKLVIWVRRDTEIVGRLKKLGNSGAVSIAYIPGT